MSDNELDAELLGMVGDDSDEEGEMSSDHESPRRSPSLEPEPSPEAVEEAPSSRKGVAQKVRAKGRRKRRPASDDEDDFGQPSPSPARSLGSEPMAQSDSDADAPGSSDTESGPIYPLEGKYLSVRDREEIMAMPEIKREEILAERAQEILKRQQDLQLKKALASAKAAGNRQKRKAAAAELEDGERRSTRPKAEKARSALDDYRRARELKGTERGRLGATQSRRADRSPSSASDRDADGDSEVDWAEPATNRRRDEPPAELRDFERCRVGRSSFAKVCFYPNFENTIKGCFCRVSIGPNRETGQNQYRMTQVKGFTEGKPYQLEGSNGKQFTVDMYAVVAQGSSEKPWPFSACSDGRFTEAEFDRFVQTLHKENHRVPTRKYLDAKLDEIHRLLNMEWTDEQISAKLSKQRLMERRHDPATAAIVKRETIQKRRLQAEEDGDADEIMRCDAELAALENSASATNGVRARPSPVKSGVHNQQERLAQINMKNRGKNAEEVRRALIEEKRKLHLAREQAITEAKSKEAARLEEEEKRKKLLGVPKSELADLFGEGSDFGTPGANTPKRSRAGTPANGAVKERSGGLSTLKKKMDDEIIAGMDFGIDMEI